jgi:hypothetical protein
MNRVCARHATTLLETLLAVAIVGVVLAILWPLYTNTFKRADRNQERVGGLAAVMILYAHLEEDLQSAVSIEEDPARPEGITIRQCDASGTPIQPPVQYRFDPALHRVSRNGVTLRSAAFRQLEFRLRRDPEIQFLELGFRMANDRPDVQEPLLHRILPLIGTVKPKLVPLWNNNRSLQ